ncbi:MAG: hypothetical protein KC910_02395 [Candidatus Eremiobacteraeota bacterium]|nr:hypothetical protein [Candidatus Eremiobacteraeota bacterium]
MAQLYEGLDRVELWPKLGRPFRMGSLAQGDRDRVAELIANRSGEAAGFAGYLLAGHTGMLATGLEWSTLWLDHFPDDPQFHRQAFAALEGLTEALSGPEAEAGRMVLAHLRPGAVDADAFMTRVQALGGPVMQALSGGDYAAAGPLWSDYFALAAALHDRLFEFCWAYASAVLAELGQARAEQALSETLRSCSFYEGAWAGGMILDTGEMAAVLAEHLRAHFSGPDRAGQATVREEEDFFLIELAPCGSGQAMRAGEAGRRPEFGAFPEASPMTWGRTDVPVYCAHCAVNELESVHRLGYPRWVTEFDPDASRPCAWKLYKDPARIPQEYFDRLGARRDPSRFVALPVSGD